MPEQYGKRLAAAGRQRGGLRAFFPDGTHTDADVLIGADGLRSTVRGLIDPGAPRARSGGLLNTGGFARPGSLPATFENEPGTMYLRFGRRSSVTSPAPTARPGGSPPHRRSANSPGTNSPPCPRPPGGDGCSSSSTATRVPAAELIQSSPHVFAGWNTYDLPSVPRWSRDSMVIMGDAAHATSPAAGQTASMAVEDAVTLALALRDEPDIEGTFRRYEQARCEPVEKVVELGKRNGTGKAAGPVTRFVRDRLVLPLAAARFSRQQSHPEAWLFDHHIDWEPVSSSTPR